jgi:hypothetical protein
MKYLPCWNEGADHNWKMISKTSKNRLADSKSQGFGPADRSPKVWRMPCQVQQLFYCDYKLRFTLNDNRKKWYITLWLYFLFHTKIKYRHSLNTCIKKVFWSLTAMLVNNIYTDINFYYMGKGYLYSHTMRINHSAACYSNAQPDGLCIYCSTMTININLSHLHYRCHSINAITVLV